MSFCPVGCYPPAVPVPDAILGTDLMIGAWLAGALLVSAGALLFSILRSHYLAGGFPRPRPRSRSLGRREPLFGRS